ncbi:hypothetical protein JTB14_021266 [Gonioctena quinquepunctata]|nr:hypothetical protein JTB14_021266 [Gonioctena quinquepunctata]
MRPNRGLTEKELLEELEKGLSDIEGVSSDDSDNEEEIQKKNVKWLQNVQYITRHLPIKISRNSNENCLEEYPVTYVLRYVPGSLFEDLVQYTNMYALQTGTEKFVPSNLATTNCGKYHQFSNPSRRDVENCRNCIDEQIRPFKGRLSIKQYIKNKPHPWGLKLYLLGGESGLTYNFLIYPGSTMEKEPSYLKYGQGATVVL